MPLLAINGVVLTDIDETRNRLRVGVENTAAREAVISQLAILNVPTDALVVEEELPVHYVAATLDTTLRQKIRPLDAGFQIARGDSVCTLGFNARDVKNPLKNFLVTNSHCSTVWGGVDFSDFYQPVVFFVDHVGRETNDPPFFTGPPCPSGKRCRHSDSSLITYDEPQSEFADFGRIARTLARSQSSGSITVNSSNPEFFITAEASGTSIGQVLDKIGRTTGWTWGQVSFTCSNINVSGTNITFLCQDAVNSGVGGGDSGAPVFRWSGSGSSVSLHGILWGSAGNGRYFFSSVGRIELEHGSLNTF